MSLQNYTKVETEPYYKTWVHNCKPVFIRQVPPTVKTQMHFRAYKAIAPVPAGRAPWTVNNVRIGSEHGFKTLEEAAAAGEGA